MGSVFLTDLRHVLSAGCTLWCGVEVACGAEVLGRRRRAAWLGGRGALIVVSCV